MIKKMIPVIILIISFVSYGNDMEQEIREARQLTWEKKYTEAEIKYKKIVQENRSEEVLLDYSNMLAWSERITEAINLLKSEKVITINMKKNMAKFYNWNKNYREAYIEYNEVKKETGTLDEEGEKFIEWYNDYKKWKLSYNYSYDMTDKNKNELPSLAVAYDEYKKYTVVITREWNYITRESGIENNNQNNYIELYVDKLYVITGKSTITNFYCGIEYTFPIITLEIKYADYKIEKIKFYKIEKVFNIKNIDITLNGIFADGGEKITGSYMVQGKYEILKISDYFDLKKENKIIISLKKEDIFKNVDLECGISRDFGKNIYGLSFGSAVKF